MKESLFQHRLRSIIGQRNSLLLISAGLLLTNITLSICVWSKDERVVVVPADFKQEVWFEKNRLSDSAKEEMAILFCHLILNISPQNAAFQRDVLLRHALPESYGRLRAQLILDEQRHAKQDLSTTFSPSTFKYSDQSNEILITGDLTSYVGQQRTTQSRETFRLKYKYGKGRFWIESFKAEEKAS